MPHILVATLSIIVQVALTYAAFVWAARCLKEEDQCSE